MSNIHQPIQTSLFKLAIPHMTDYQSDLGHDAVCLCRAVPGDVFLWGYRRTGTHMQKIEKGQENNILSILNQTKKHVTGEEWFLLKVTAIRGMTVDGMIEKIHMTLGDFLLTETVKFPV
jgi:hypothetical protein